MLVNNIIYSGFTSVTVMRSLKAVAGAFDISISNNWASTKKGWVLSPGDSVVLKLDGIKVITGFIDKIESEYDGTTRNIRISGRDKTADLVDCSYTGPSSLSKISIQDFIKKVLQPFGISFKSNVSLSTIVDEFKSQQGETSFAFLERALRLRGLMLTSNTEGELIISSIGEKRANHALVEGVNLLSAKFSFDSTERYSDYLVKGQSTPSDEFSDEQINEVSSKFKDTAVVRFRPLIIMAEGAVDSKLAKERARWESQTRNAKSSLLKVSLRGWSKKDGELWFPNEVANFRSKYFGFDLDLLITEVTFKQDSSGTTTELTLENKNAYLPENKQESKRDIWKELNPQ